MTTASTSLRLADIVAATGQPYRYVFTDGYFKICHRCCKTKRAKFALDPLWRIKTDAINKKNVYLECHNCGQPIPIIPL